LLLFGSKKKEHFGGGEPRQGRENGKKQSTTYIIHVNFVTISREMMVPHISPIQNDQVGIPFFSKVPYAKHSPKFIFVFICI